jgi:hypothetical protein
MGRCTSSNRYGGAIDTDRVLAIGGWEVTAGWGGAGEARGPARHRRAHGGRRLGEFGVRTAAVRRRTAAVQVGTVYFFPFLLFLAFLAFLLFLAMPSTRFLLEGSTIC